jgi:hypothetical protein
MQWIEALLNVSAFAGFVGVANCWPKCSLEEGSMRPGKAIPPLK